MRLCSGVLRNGGKSASRGPDRRFVHHASQSVHGQLTNPHRRCAQFPQVTSALGRVLHLAITMEDLYPGPSWNFVFGQASPRERVGVYSFARYDPAFYGEPQTRDYGALVLRRSCKVLAHETAHIFGLAHCIYFSCLMNGSNHLAESDRRPLHLCPVCLRKLEWSIGFDVVRRYASLERVTREASFMDEAEWLSRQLKRLSSE